MNKMTIALILSALAVGSCVKSSTYDKLKKKLKATEATLAERDKALVECDTLCKERDTMKKEHAALRAASDALCTERDQLKQLNVNVTRQLTQVVNERDSMIFHDCKCDDMRARSMNCAMPNGCCAMCENC